MAEKTIWLKVINIDTYRRAMDFLKSIKVPAKWINHVDWNQIRNFYYLTNEEVSRVPKDAELWHVDFLLKVKKGTDGQSVETCRNVAIMKVKDARYGYIEKSKAKLEPGNVDVHLQVALESPRKRNDAKPKPAKASTKAKTVKVTKSLVKQRTTPEHANFWADPKDQGLGWDDADPDNPKEWVKVDTVIPKNVDMNEFATVFGIVYGGKWEVVYHDEGMSKDDDERTISVARIRKGNKSTKSKKGKTAKPASGKTSEPGYFVIYEENNIGELLPITEGNKPKKFKTKADADFYVQSMISDDPDLYTVDNFRVVHKSEIKKNNNVKSEEEDDQAMDGDYIVDSSGDAYVMGSTKRGKDFIGKRSDFDDDDDRLWEAIVADMNKRQYWPNVWYVQNGEVMGHYDYPDMKYYQLVKLETIVQAKKALKASGATDVSSDNAKYYIGKFYLANDTIHKKKPFDFRSSKSDKNAPKFGTQKILVVVEGHDSHEEVDGWIETDNGKEVLWLLPGKFEYAVEHAS